MKKLITTLLTLVFVLSFGLVAFATEGNNVPVTSELKLVYTKDYDIEWSGVNPGETVAFTISADRVENSTETVVPLFEEPEFTITVPKGTTPANSIEINFPDYSNVGSYYYQITETEGETAGVHYDIDPMYLRVVVIEESDGVFKPAYYNLYRSNLTDKPSGIVNKYRASNLTISKEVAGNFGDKSQYFAVNVQFVVPEGKSMGSTITYIGGQYTTAQTFTGLQAPIEIKHGESITFSNIPEGVTYIVTETVPADYTGETVYSDENKMINSKETDTVLITNTRVILPDTGISFDSIPYILLLGFAVLGISVMFFRKRQNSNF